MTKDKDLKRRVRARMEKTGESYTAARAALRTGGRPRKDDVFVAPRSEWPTLAGMSDDAVAKATGRRWAEWVDALEAVGAHAWPHRDIARHLVDEHQGVSFWWAQTVTIAYERIRGLRDVGQRRGGSYDANKSRTFAVDVTTLYRAIRDVRRRRQWLPEGISEVRTATVDKSIRADWHDGTRVSFTFTDKGARKSSVSLQHSGLASREDVERVKAAWQARLDALRAHLADA